MADLFINYGKDAGEMTRQLLQAADVAKSLRASTRVVLKPNLVVDRPASEGATTHPEIVEAVILYLKEAGVGHITVAEGAWVGCDTDSAFSRCGYGHLQKKYGVRLMDLKQDKTRGISSHGLDLEICETALAADCLINLPVLKAHCQTKMTCCLKNLKGCIPDREKRRYHGIGLHKPIAALAGALRPPLHIVDSICGDLTFEEGGNPVQTDRVLLGFDGVTVDSYCAGLLGYRPEEIEHLRLAASCGAGRLWDEQCRLVELNAKNRPRTTPAASRKARELGKWIEEDSACSACYAALVFALDKLGGRLPDEPGKIKIGQGFRGKSAGGIGAGSCASGCPRHIPGCPPKAVDIVQKLQEWL